ncbi:MAG: ASCH domain-containing protein [Roseburia sp.]|nr:ASCH domain-containing protein [Ruminococcus flavefaciens]MCM1368237.1 ASCH domain-containing protein [Roseburia sp.]MCM1368291.1 ASCH domain-containing protein [Roseburia sp.]
MVKIYVDLIRAGKMTLDCVPEKWRAAVADALEE